MIYYLSATGNGPGTSPDIPRRTIPALAAGDSILFNRGDTFSPFSVVSGVTVGAYGVGPRPIFRLDAQSTSTSKIGFDFSGDSVTFKDIRVSLINPYRNPSGIDPTGLGVKFGWYVGFVISGDNVVIDNCELDHLSLGIYLQGTSSHCKVINSHIHGLDTLWRIDAPGAMGALGILAHGNDHEIAYNILEDNWVECIVNGVRQSYSAPFEIYSANRVNVHHNQAFEHRKSIEFGKAPDKTCQDNIFAYNLLVSARENGRGPNIHGNDIFGPVERTVVDHNTIILTGALSQALISGGPGTISKNNILSATAKAAFYGGTYTEHHNIYQGRFQASVPISSTSLIANPLLENFKPTQESPAIGKGENGSTIGAFEREGDFVAIIEDLQKIEDDLRAWAADLAQRSADLIAQAEMVKANIVLLNALDDRLDDLSTEIH